MDLEGKKVLVIGLARTGVATVRFLVERGARVKVSEMKPSRELAGALQELEGLPLEWEMGGHTLPFFGDAELIVVSPGVSMGLQPLKQARGKELPVISEIELASRFLRRPMIAITGTNGKTTTTTLVGEIFRAAGRAAFVGGNIGNPLVNFAAGSQREEWAVVEVSSFQLEGIEGFCPRVAVLLNITEDHLDRHSSFREYGQIKGRIFENQGKEDFAVLNADDPRTFHFAHRVRSQVVLFSRERPVPWGCFLDRGSIIFQGAEGGKEGYGLGRMKIRGAHNLENFMAAVATCRICGCPPEALQKVIDGFEGLEHRLEWVGNIDGVNFYNDSKGTNVGAVVKSLLSFEEPVLLIAGGRDKEGDYGPLRSLVAGKVRGMALIGEARERMCQALGDLTETLKADSLEEAVSWARSKARPGDVILLSPACSSFDMFVNYQERGRRFKAIIRELERGKSPRPEKERTPG
jgi:UDP-N-acetylmuramoylalanine--D-glutamate ligase